MMLAYFLRASGAIGRSVRSSSSSNRTPPLVTVTSYRATTRRNAGTSTTRTNKKNQGLAALRTQHQELGGGGAGKVAGGDRQNASTSTRTKNEGLTALRTQHKESGAEKVVDGHLADIGVAPSSSRSRRQGRPPRRSPAALGSPNSSSQTSKVLQVQQSHPDPVKSLDSLKARTLEAMRDRRSKHRAGQSSSSGGSHGFELGSLFQDWNTSLSRAEEDPRALRPLVELVDELVRHNHRIHEQLLGDPSSSPVSCYPLDEMYAVCVGISSWARISSAYRDAASRAQDLFELLPAPVLTSVPWDVQSAFVERRRSLYNALLLAWSRHPVRPAAAGRCSDWLLAMKREEIKFRYHCGLVDVYVYNGVMRAHARAGNVKEVERLWSEMLESGIQPNSLSFDARIMSYQVALSPVASSKIGESGGNQQLESPFLSRAEHVFRGQLEQCLSREYTRESCRPLPLTLARVLYMFEHLPGEALSLLQAAWNLERDRPECRGLVNARHVTSVLLSLTAKGRVEEAEGLLARMIQRYEDDSNDSLSPSRRHFGIVMHGYARRESPDSLRKAESILTRLEDLLVRGKHLPGDSEENNRVVYNILLTAYLQAWPNDAVVSIRRILNRMKRLAMGLKKPELLPDSISYAILMNALIRHGAPGYEEEVESILESMKQESRKAAQPRMHCYAAALEAWAKSDDPRAIAKAMAILDSIKSPSTACFNIVLNAYATRGLLDDAVQLLKRMEENFESGRNKNCQPDSITYSVTLNTYAKQGLVDEAVEILKRMKDEFESGRNQTCEPDSIAYLSVLHSLSSYAHETTSRRWEKALTCFDDMCESFRRGNPRCRPDQATITALLHVLRTCDDVTAKNVAAREVLERLVRLGLPQGPCIARSFILACGETVGPYDVRSEAMQFIWGLLRSLSAEQLDADMYRDVLESCHNLLFDRIDEKNRLIEDVFGQCTRTGHVSLLLLQTLFRISPPDLYSALTSHEAGRAPGFATIPDHWKRNVR